MNQTIQEIVNKVGTDVSGKWMAVDKIDQLTRLIVTECINTVEKRFTGDLNREDQEVRRCVTELKNHFGIAHRE